MNRAQPVESDRSAPTGLSNPEIQTLDGINLAVMVLAAAAAWLVPFETLVLAYAVLGPLHYLTQISWLHERKYFVAGRVGPILLLLAAALISFGKELDHLLRFDWRLLLIFGAFTTAAILVATARSRIQAVLVPLVLVLVYLLREWPVLALTAFFLPTVLHIFVFTGAFQLTGALRSRSPLALLSFAIFVIIATGFLLYRPAVGDYSAAAFAIDGGQPFDQLKEKLAVLFGLDISADSLLAITRFLAWAYTYHYLNWFSKTKLLRWHAVSKTRITLLAVLYAVCLGLYAYDYTLGFLVVGFVGMVHVFLEFPLDIRALAALPRHLVTFVRG